MSRLPVLAEQFTESPVAVALREHRADRNALLESLVVSLDADPCVRAAWLWGSFGRNEADDLSDLDLWVIVVDNAAAGFGSRCRLYAERSGSLISGGEKPSLGPVGGGYFGSLHEGRHGLIHLDCYWQQQSAEIVVPEHAVLINRLREAMPTSPSASATNAKIEVEASEVESGLGFAWLMFSITAKYLARDPYSDLGLMFYAREGIEKAITLLGQEDALLPLDWAVPDSPLEKVDRLRYLVGRADHTAASANAQGLSLLRRYVPCLFCYLDLVEGVLRSRL